jgi:hypothetical protein
MRLTTPVFGYQNRYFPPIYCGNGILAVSKSPGLTSFFPILPNFPLN